jgi:hypothetical protein
MLACIHSRKFGAAIVDAANILGGTSVDCYSQTGSIHRTVVKAGFIVGTGSGTGTLDCEGRTYRLRVSSFGFGTIGVSGGRTVGHRLQLTDRRGHRRRDRRHNEHPLRHFFSHRLPRAAHVSCVTRENPTTASAAGLPNLTKSLD